jgi:IclR family KDG regulon transcriptional repressor
MASVSAPPTPAECHPAPLDDTEAPSSSIERALALLFALDGDRPIGVAELSRRAALPKSTAHRLLGILERRGVVARVGQKYTLGVSLFELGSAVRVGSSVDIRELARPALQELWKSTGETVHLAVLVDCDVLYLEKLGGNTALAMPSRVGSRLPAHCTALGKALLAYSRASAIRHVLEHGLQPRTRHTIVRGRLLLEHLRRIHGCGVAFDQQELELGVVCVASPVLDASNHAIASISVSGRPLSADRHAAAVRRAAAEVSRAVAPASHRQAIAAG